MKDTRALSSLSSPPPQNVIVEVLSSDDDDDGNNNSDDNNDDDDDDDLVCISQSQTSASVSSSIAQSSVLQSSSQQQRTISLKKRSSQPSPPSQSSSSQLSSPESPESQLEEGDSFLFSSDEPFLGKNQNKANDDDNRPKSSSQQQQQQQRVNDGNDNHLDAVVDMTIPTNKRKRQRQEEEEGSHDTDVVASAAAPSNKKPTSATTIHTRMLTTNENTNDDDPHVRKSEETIANDGTGTATTTLTPATTDCSICMNPVEKFGMHQVCCLACGHLFGKKCIEKWLSRQKTCPLCQKTSYLSDIRLLFIDSHHISVVLSDEKWESVRLKMRKLRQVLQEKNELIAQLRAQVSTYERQQQQRDKNRKQTVISPRVSPSSGDHHYHHHNRRNYDNGDDGAMTTTTMMPREYDDELNLTNCTAGDNSDRNSCGSSDKPRMNMTTHCSTIATPQQYHIRPSVHRTVSSPYTPPVTTATTTTATPQKSARNSPNQRSPPPLDTSPPPPLINSSPSLRSSVKHAPKTVSSNSIVDSVASPLFHHIKTIPIQDGRVFDFHPSEPLLATSFKDTNDGAPSYKVKQIKLTDISFHSEFSVHTDVIRDMQYCPMNHNLLLTVSTDKSAKVTDLRCFSPPPSTASTSSSHHHHTNGLSFHLPHPAWSCCWSGENVASSTIFFVGCQQSNELYCFDVRKPGTCINKYQYAEPHHRNTSLTSLQYIPSSYGSQLSGVLAGGMSGLHFFSATNGFDCYDLSMDPNCVSVCYDRASRQCLATFRRNDQKSVWNYNGDHFVFTLRGGGVGTNTFDTMTRQHIHNFRNTAISKSILFHSRVGGQPQQQQQQHATRTFVCSADESRPSCATVSIWDVATGAKQQDIVLSSSLLSSSSSVSHHQQHAGGSGSTREVVYTCKKHGSYLGIQTNYSLSLWRESINE